MYELLESIMNHFMELILLIIIIAVAIFIVNYYSREGFRGGRMGGFRGSYGNRNRPSFFPMFRGSSFGNTQGYPNGHTCNTSRQCMSRKCVQKKCVP
jgi:hypothetical protein